MAKEAFATKGEKLTFLPQGKPLKSSAQLYDRFTDSRHLIVSGAVTVYGDVGKTGLVVQDSDEVIAAVKHPMHIPHSLDMKTQQAEFGGQQTETQVSASMERVLGMERVSLDAQDVIRSIQERGLGITAQNTGALIAGNEPEEHALNPDGSPFVLPPEWQQEVQHNLGETATHPSADSKTQAIYLAQDRMRRSADQSVSQAIWNDTSMGIPYLPQDLLLNTDHDHLGPYVTAITNNLFVNALNGRDPVSLQLWNSVAQTNGYKNFDDMKKKLGTLAFWDCAASHASVGLFHRRLNGGLYTSVEEAIALSDLFASEFGLLAEWMTYSTPIVFGEKVPYVDKNGQTYNFLDARAAMRHIMDTTFPAPFIGNPATLKDRITEAMLDGTADRLDRASYVTVFPGNVKVASAHGAVRNRMSQGDGLKPHDNAIGRVEFTGGGSTPDIVATVARNAFLQLLAVYSYEALAQGQYPKEYQNGLFPHMNSWEHRLELSHEYNFKQTNSSQAMKLVQDGMAFLDYMQAHYKTEDMQYLINTARIGMQKLYEPATANNLTEFLQHPQGLISQVITNMYDQGMAPVQIAHAIHEYQMQQAQILLDQNGDVVPYSPHEVANE